MSSSAEELSLELSGSGSIVDGVVAKGSSSASGSSSSGVGVIKESKPKRTFARELSARRAGTSELVPRQPVSMETGTSEDALVLPQGEPRVLGPGPSTEVPMTTFSCVFTLFPFHFSVS